MGQNKFGHWDDKAMARAEARHARKKKTFEAKIERLSFKEEVRHEAAMKRLREMEQQMLKSLRADRDRETEALVTLWPEPRDDLPTFTFEGRAHEALRPQNSK